MGVCLRLFMVCSSRVLPLTHWSRKGNVVVDITRPWSSLLLVFSLPLTSIAWVFPSYCRWNFCVWRGSWQKCLGHSSLWLCCQEENWLSFPSSSVKIPRGRLWWALLGLSTCRPGVWNTVIESRVKLGAPVAGSTERGPRHRQGHRGKSLWIGSTTMGDFAKAICNALFLSHADSFLE